jgi:hypothetical protein
MPVNYKGSCFLPRSVKKEELWTCIIAKAIMKLLSLTNNFDNNFPSLTGSGFIMYALTGHLSETVKI